MVDALALDNIRLARDPARAPVGGGTAEQVFAPHSLSWALPFGLTRGGLGEVLGMAFGGSKGAPPNPAAVSASLAELYGEDPEAAAAWAAAYGVA